MKISFTARLLISLVLATIILAACGSPKVSSESDLFKINDDAVVVLSGRTAPIFPISQAEAENPAAYAASSPEKMIYFGAVITTGAQKEVVVSPMGTFTTLTFTGPVSSVRYFKVLESDREALKALCDSTAAANGAVCIYMP